MIWITKDIVFPDKNFQEKASIPVSLITAVILVLYWLIGFMMMFGYGDQNPHPERVFICIFMYVFGIFLMICSDLQKFITLRYKYNNIT